jgi:hypothetical protein
MRNTAVEEVMHFPGGFGADGLANPADHTYRFEVVAHQKPVSKVVGKTIRMKIDDGDWHYGIEELIETVVALMHSNGMEVDECLCRTPSTK